MSRTPLPVVSEPVKFYVTQTFRSGRKMTLRFDTWQGAELVRRIFARQIGSSVVDVTMTRK